MSVKPNSSVQVKRTQLFINNAFVDSVSGKKFKTVNPANGKVTAEVSEGFAEDINLAVEAASQAFASGSEWRKLTASQRGLLLNKLADLVERDAEYLANLETLDVGKPVEFAFGDMAEAVKQLRYYAGWADKIDGRTNSSNNSNLLFTKVEAVGVVGVILPWNFPLMLVALKCSAALAAGCTLVIKPAEQTPLTALYFAQLVAEAGFPKGVFNVVTGYGPTAGEPLVLHPKVDKITFTGSSEIGKHIQSISAKFNLKRVTLELGGKSPLVVMPSFDIDQAAQIAHFALFFNMGECCCAGSRTYVHEKIYDEFVKKAVALAKLRKVGCPFQIGTEHGPLIDEAQFNKVLELMDSGVKDGATLETGGKVWPDNKGGYYVQPTVFSNVQDNHRIAREEIFGPCQQIFKFSTLKEAITRSNDTEYGLAAGILTNDITEAMQYVNEVRAGTVWVNTFLDGSVQMPFGGYKLSGHGREGGVEGLNPFCEVKTVILNIPALN